MAPERVRLRSLQWQARAPRIAFTSAAAVLALIGAREVVSPAPSSTAPAAPASVSARDVGGYAELYARTLLQPVGDSDEGTGRERRLIALGGVDPVEDVTRLTESVTWTAAVAAESHGSTTTVTVAVTQGDATTYWAVPVTTDSAGRRSVRQPPAIVGPPAAAPALPAPEREVDDPRLRQVATRALKHYIAGDAGDLAADLDDSAAVSVPNVGEARLGRVESVTWARRGVVAVSASVRTKSAGQMTLRYELVVRGVGGRWLVRQVSVNPRSKEPR